MRDKLLTCELLYSIGDGVCVLDMEGRILNCNKEISKYTDRCLGELTGCLCSEVIHATPHLVDDCPFLKVRDTLSRAQLEFNKDGQWLKCTADPIVTDEGILEGVVSILSDITEKKIVEKSLSENEEKYRQLFELVSDAIFLIDNETGQILEVNEAASELYGFTHDELLRMKHTDVSAEPAETRRVTLAGVKVVPVRWHRKKNGTVFPVEISARHLVWQGRPAHIAAIRDITERKRADEALQESEERYRSLIEHNPDAVYSLDFHGTFTSANESTCRISGYSREELDQMNFGRMLVPEEAERIWQRFEKASKGEPQNYDITIIRKEGRLVALNITNTPIIVSGEIVGVYGIAKDITDRKWAEEALRESDDRFRALFDRSLDCVGVIDFEGRFIDVNSTFLKMFGYVTADIPSLSIDSLLDKNQLAVAHKQIEEIVQNGFQKELREYRVMCKDGTYLDVEAKTSIIHRNGKPYSILGIARNITESKKAEQELQKSYEKVQKTLEDTVQAIAVMVETRDPYTAGHQKKVADLACAIAIEMNLSSDQIIGIRTAGVIHDIGKIAIPAEILSKPAKLTDIEFSLIKTHSQAGYDILKDIEFPWPIARIVLEHHERVDGSGYPNGLSGEKILMESKILAVADVVEAIASHRPYRPGLGIDVAITEITKNRGICYDPEVVDICLSLFREKGYKFDG